MRVNERWVRVKTLEFGSMMYSKMLTIHHGKNEASTEAYVFDAEIINKNRGY